MSLEAVKQGRKGIGCELKSSYYRQSVANKHYGQTTLQYRRVTAG